MSIREHSRNARGHGATLIELVIFIMVVSLAVAGILLVMNITTQHSADPQLRKQALAIAESLLEEVESAGFTYCDASDSQAPFATQAVVGPVGPGGPNGGATGGCTSAATVENVGPEAGDARPYDNVNDYVDALGTPKTYVISDVNGSAITNFSGTYAATITITKATLPGATMWVDPGANASLGSALLIKVSVTYNNNTVILEGYRTQYAPRVNP
jgi:MSHA pilin protein MshD